MVEPALHVSRGCHAIESTLTIDLIATSGTLRYVLLGIIDKSNGLLRLFRMDWAAVLARYYFDFFGELIVITGVLATCSINVRSFCFYRIYTSFGLVMEADNAR